MHEHVIYRGDDFPIAVSWFLPDINNPFTEGDAVLSAAVVSLVRLRDGKTIFEQVPAAIEGNDTVIVIPNSDLTIDGTYAAFVSAEMNDGTHMTRRIPFEVRPRR